MVHFAFQPGEDLLPVCLAACTPPWSCQAIVYRQWCTRSRVGAKHAHLVGVPIWHITRVLPPTRPPLLVTKPPFQCKTTVLVAKPPYLADLPGYLLIYGNVHISDLWKCARFRFMEMCTFPCNGNVHISDPFENPISVQTYKGPRKYIYGTEKTRIYGPVNVPMKFMTFSKKMSLISPSLGQTGLTLAILTM